MDEKKSKILSDMLPKVRFKRGNEMAEAEFNQIKIIVSLERETTLTGDQIKQLLVRFYKIMLPMKLDFITPPTIREILCTIMMELKWLKNRYEYTRIGLPRADIQQIIDDPDFKEIIAEHMRFEYNEVQKEAARG